MKTLIVCLILFCGMGASPCWTKHHGVYQQPYVVNVIPTVVTQPIMLYQPVVVQERRWVPVVENRVEYRPVNSYYLNYGHYYQYAPYGYYNQYDPWVRYNY
jgi:hypothetical protein